MREAVNFEKLNAIDPKISELWNLAAQITQSTFGEDEIFFNRSPEDHMAQQLAGQDLIPELRAGIYDRGLAAAVSGNVGSWKSRTSVHSSRIIAGR